MVMKGSILDYAPSCPVELIQRGIRTLIFYEKRFIPDTLNLGQWHANLNSLNVSS